MKATHLFSFFLTPSLCPKTEYPTNLLISFSSYKCRQFSIILTISCHCQSLTIFLLTAKQFFLVTIFLSTTIQYSPLVSIFLISLYSLLYFFAVISQDLIFICLDYQLIISDQCKGLSSEILNMIVGFKEEIRQERSILFGGFSLIFYLDCFCMISIFVYRIQSLMNFRKIGLPQEVTDSERFAPYQLFFGFEGKQQTQREIMHSEETKELRQLKTNTKKHFSDPILSDISHTLTEQSLIYQSQNEGQIRSHHDQLSPNPSCSINLDAQNNFKSKALRSNLQRLKRKKARGSELKDLINKQKTSNIVRTFVQKLKRNNIFAPIIQYDIFKEAKTQTALRTIRGIQLNEDFELVFELTVLILHVVLIYFYTLSLSFSLQHEGWSQIIERVALVVFFMDFCINIISVKIVEGKKVEYIRQIARQYLSQQMLIDLLMIIILIVDVTGETEALQYFKLLIIVKIPSCMEKMQKLQMQLITNSYKEQYWSIIKVFLFNFCFAHLLAIILKAMANVSPSGYSWLSAKNLVGEPWYEIYIWAYYWAVNIMLTVGFGDITATNYQQALCLIFIETFSCIALAYNINCVGSLISNIRAQDLQKCKKYKIFRSLANKHDLSNELFLKVTNYIEQSNNIKKKFNIEEENKFIDSLPKIFKKDYLNQSNKSIFQNVYFFRNLADKAIQSLAESIEITITHPSETILTMENFLNLKILKQGTIGYCCKRTGCDYNGKILDKITVQQGGLPFLIGLQFLTGKPPIYQIKSLVYSVTYSLSFDKLISSLRKSRGDYEFFCFLRDKNKHILDEFQILQCDHCKTNHTKFTCPKLHFIPIVQHVINKTLWREKVGRNQRMQMSRIDFVSTNALANFRIINEVPRKNTTISTFKKNEVFVIKQLLSNIEKYQTYDFEVEKTKNFFDYQLLFLSNAADSIKQEITSFLRRQNEEDVLWTLSSDTMQNYKGYFPEDNPCNLQKKTKSKIPDQLTMGSKHMIDEIEMETRAKNEYKSPLFFSTKHIDVDKADNYRIGSIQNTIKQ